MSEPTVAPRVSFVMPNFNHAHYLRQALHGLLQQTRPADEILVFDDASTDDSVKIIQDSAAREPRITLVAREKTLGVVAGLNEGLQKACGDFIAFPAADDFVAPEFLQTCLALLQAHPQAAFASGRAEIWNADSKAMGLRPVILPRMSAGFITPAGYRNILRSSDNHFLGAVTLYRRSALLGLGGFDASLGPLCDGLLARRLAARHGFCFTPAILGAWRNDGTNYSIQQATDVWALNSNIQKMQDVLKAEPPGLFNEDYPARLARRMRFGGARLLIGKDDLHECDVQKKLQTLGLASKADIFLTHLASFSGAAGRKLLALWAFIRFKPFSATRLFVQRLLLHRS